MTAKPREKIKRKNHYSEYNYKLKLNCMKEKKKRLYMILSKSQLLYV